MKQGVSLTPPGWYYHRFPAPADGEALDLDAVTDLALALFERARRTGDEEAFGAVPHWAHVLKSEQGPGGDWPARVNARTGAPLGTERTRRPAQVLATLGAWLRSSEFDAAVELASRGEHDGR